MIHTYQATASRDMPKQDVRTQRREAIALEVRAHGYDEFTETVAALLPDEDENNPWHITIQSITREETL